MSNLMKEVTNIHLKENLTFEQVYHQVKARQSRDPLQEHGLSIEEFDALLDKHQKDDEVKKGIRDVLTAGSVKLSASAPSITVLDIIEVHEFMSRELHQIVADSARLRRANLEKNAPHVQKCTTSTLTIAAQAIVASRILKTYNYNTEQIEAAVQANFQKLNQNSRFSKLIAEIQGLMAQLQIAPL
jgi:hypothetical protein